VAENIGYLKRPPLFDSLSRFRSTLVGDWEATLDVVSHSSRRAVGSRGGNTVKRAFTVVRQGNTVSRTADGEKTMGVADAKSPTSDTATEMLEGGIRALVRRNRLAVAAELVAEPSEDALIAGATSIADIDKLMEELQTARDYLQSEGERVRRMTARYAHLAETASASVKIIAESLGKWRNAETLSQEHPALPRAYAPDLSPVDDGEHLHESNDQ
jgi:hypothetical protein